MNERSDLTRWNRAGLQRFRYIDGNAATFLELLRTELAERFPEWDAINQDPPPDEKNIPFSGPEREEKIGERNEQLLAQYHNKNREWAWLIARTLARGTHILTEYMDAYANEGYLGTATQWEHVRRMVEMLDYHPSPPASAMTHLALIAKKAGKVNAGFPVKYSPPDGGEAVVFETLDDLEISPELNALHPKDWNLSQGTLNGGEKWVTADGKTLEKLDVSAGSVAILLDEKKQQGTPVLITGVDNQASKLNFDALPADNKSSTRLLVCAKGVRPVLLHGKGVIEFDQSPGLSKGNVIGWNSLSTFEFNEVLEVEGNRVRLAAGSFPSETTTGIFRLNKIALSDVGQPKSGGIVFPLAFLKVVVRDNGCLQFSGSDKYKDVTDSQTSKAYCKQVKDPNIKEIYVLYATDEAIQAKVKKVQPTDFVINGSSKGFKSGSWVVGERGADRFAMRITSIEEHEENFVVRFDSVCKAATPAISESLSSALGKVEAALDENYLKGRTLSFFLDGGAALLPILAIQGVGEKYAGLLSGRLKNKNGKEAKLATIGDLLQWTVTAIAGIPKARLREFKTKAEMVLGVAATDEAKELAGHDVLDLIEKGVSPAAVSQASPDITGIERIHGPFAHTLYPEGYDRNEDCVSEQIELESAMAESLKGKIIMLHNLRNGAAFASSVREATGKTITLNKAVPQKEFTKADTVLYANVARAGHGESKPEKILGSGDATQSNQSFIFGVKNVSFVPDATMASGVRAAIELSVEGRIWEQVSTLNDSMQADMHYVVRMTEEGFLKITSGDGIHGRRLPTGANNIRVAYRVGMGLHGNLPAASLVKPALPNPYVESVRQPLRCSGGNEMEDIASLKEHAPAKVLTLERAVSIEDFARLAASNSSVWQANAFLHPESLGREELIEVVVVPADGGDLGDLEAPLHDYLMAHALPGVRIIVSRYNELNPRLKVTASINSKEFDHDVVVAQVRAALLDNFSLKRRKLGANLYLGDIYAVVENITGVERSVCILRGDPQERVIKAESGRQVIFLEARDLDVTFEEYRL